MAQLMEIAGDSYVKVSISINSFTLSNVVSMLNAAYRSQNPDPTCLAMFEKENGQNFSAQ